LLFLLVVVASAAQFLLFLLVVAGAAQFMLSLLVVASTAQFLLFLLLVVASAAQFLLFLLVVASTAQFMFFFTLITDEVILIFSHDDSFTFKTFPCYSPTCSEEQSSSIAVSAINFAFSVPICLPASLLSDFVAHCTFCDVTTHEPSPSYRCSPVGPHSALSFYSQWPSLSLSEYPRQNA